MTPPGGASPALEGAVRAGELTASLAADAVLTTLARRECKRVRRCFPVLPPRPVIGILHPGAMGAAVGDGAQALRGHGDLGGRRAEPHHVETRRDGGSGRGARTSLSWSTAPT